MGLDTIELVWQVEEHFGIQVQQSKFGGLRTVGDLAALIHERLRAAKQQSCRFLKSYLSLRALVREVVGDPRLRIHPEEVIADELMPSQVRMLWKRLPEKYDFTPASLWLTPNVRGAIQIFLWGLLLLTIYASFFVHPGFLFGLFAVLFIAVALAYVVNLWRCIPPPGWATFGELTLKIVGTVAATKQTQLQTMDEVLAELRPLIVEHVGGKPEEISAEMTFKELGFD